MKKTMILAAFAALISLASCQKEEVIDSNGIDKTASPVFTASIAGATKTTIDLTDGKVAWETTDVITVTDAASVSAVYTIESIDATTGKATFVLKANETALGDGPYTATYGTEPATAQTYSATAGKLYMTAPETSNNSFTFTVQCGLMKLNLTKTGESVKSIAVTGTPTGGSETTYILTCDPAESIASAKDFFIALPDGNYKKIEITNASDIKCTLNSTSGVTVAANHIKPVTFGESKINFAPVVPDGALAGVFSVSATKKVRFSRGNMYWDGDSFEFEVNQYDYSTALSASHVSHLYWSKSASVAYAASYSESGTSTSDVFFTNATETTAKSDFTVNGVTGKYRALSQTEWDYLFKNHARKWITVCSIKGYAIAPDVVSVDAISDTYQTDAAWKTAQDAGVLFLPAAGFRNAEGEGYGNVGGRGYYWSSSASNNSIRAICAEFYSIGYEGLTNDERKYGESVRLVTDVNAETE